MPELDTPELQAVVTGAPLARVVPVGTNDLIAIGTAGYQFVDQGQWEMAFNAFDALTQLTPKLCIGWAGLGVVALKQNKLDEALQYLTKAIELRSNDPAICTNLGETMLRLGQPDQATVLLRCAVQLDPGGRNSIVNRARAMLAGIEESKAAAASPNASKPQS